VTERVTAEIAEYYAKRYDEGRRMLTGVHEKLEWIRTLEILQDLLPPKARILDVGGGTGVYARALTVAGHRVKLLDLVPEHVAQALVGDPPVEAAVADTRQLPEADDSYDATLLLGPLYHLISEQDRIAALTEAVRVTRPGGAVAAAAISRFQGPLDFAATGRLVGPWVEWSRRLIDDGVHDASNGWFTHAYFHRAEELDHECRAAGLQNVVIHGVEGPAWTVAEATKHYESAETTFQSALELARSLSSEPSLVAASAHLLATGTVAG
jgi:ubiquinone/menaquinone biosynthesis C-methylase UbiE